MAEGVIPRNSERYQIDLMNLRWKNHFDVSFLLDVIEHIPNDIRAVQEVSEAMKPGGLLFVSTPAFK